jgi:hypothetical protein
MVLRFCLPISESVVQFLHTSCAHLHGRRAWAFAPLNGKVLILNVLHPPQRSTLNIGSVLAPDP